MAQSDVSHNTKPKTNEERSKKRRFFGGKRDGPRAKKRKLNYETDLTKSRNIILVSCQKFQEKTCGRALKLVFTEYIEEFIKTNVDTTESDKNDTNPPVKNESNESNDDASKQNSDEDIDVVNANDSETKTDEDSKNKTETNEEKKEKTETTESNEADEDDDLQMNKTKEIKGEITEKTEENNAEISISDAIQNELSNINKTSVCEWIKGPDGLVVIDILDKRVAASKLLDFVFNKTHPDRPTLSPYVYKLFPLDCTSFSRTEDMIALGQKMIEKENWDAVPAQDPYAINYKNRGNKKLSKDRTKIVQEIAAAVPQNYNVDLNNPKTVILLQTFGRTAGISIIPNGAFAKHKEYNMGNFE